MSVTDLEAVLARWSSTASSEEALQEFAELGQRLYAERMGHPLLYHPLFLWAKDQHTWRKATGMLDCGHYPISSRYRSSWRYIEPYRSARQTLACLRLLSAIFGKRHAALDLYESEVDRVWNEQWEDHRANCLHGTSMGYSHHKRMSEKPCSQCRAWSAKRQRDYLQSNPEARLLARERANHISRAKRHQLPYQVGISRDAVLERYGSDCHICAEPIDLEAVWPDRRSFSIDHVIPLVAGPEVSPGHVWSNVRPSHLGCNLSKNQKSA